MKPESTYSMGMKPLLYSIKQSEKEGLGWYRDGFNITYYQNARKRNTTNTSTLSASTSASAVSGSASTGYYGSYYSLTFEVEFKHDFDTVYFAHCYPYTYSDLCD